MTYKRIVVKVGTSTLTHDNGRMNYERMEKLVRTLCDLQNRDLEVILVTSGAIAAGVSRISLQERPKELRAKQAVAAIGQAVLMNVYDKIAGEYGVNVAQILLTRADTDIAERRQNLTATMSTLLEWGVLPIVNENDSVSPEEIENIHSKIFGDNDTLSAVVAQLTGADLLVLLSDIDGLYDKNPQTSSDAQLISDVHEINAELQSIAGGAGSSRGTGGMLTKLSAAEIALKNGFSMIIANGKTPEVLYDIVAGKKVGTLFSRLGD